MTARVGHIVLAEEEMSLGSGDRHVRLKPFRGLRRLLGDHFNARLELEARDEFGNRRAITRKIHVR